MISLELCEISLIFREIKTTTAKQFLPTCSKSQKNIDLYDWNYAARPERAEALKFPAISKAFALTGRLADCLYTQGVALG